MQIKFKLELPEKVGWNDFTGGHWRKWSKANQLYKSFLIPQIKSQLNSLSETQKCNLSDFIDNYDDWPIEVYYRFIWRIRPLDWSNCCEKLVEDCFVKAGVFPDDSPKYISGGVKSSEKGPKGQKGDWVEVIWTM